MVDGHRVRRPPEASDRVHFCVSRLHCKRFVRRKNAPGAQPSTAGGGRNGMANVGLTGQSDRAVGDLSQQTTTCRPPRPSQISWNGPTASQVSGVEPWPAMQEDWRARVAKPQGLRFAAVAPPWAPRRSGHSATPAHIAGESHVHRDEVPHPLVWGRLVHPSGWLVLRGSGPVRPQLWVSRPGRGGGLQGAMPRSPGSGFGVQGQGAVPEQVPRIGLLAPGGLLADILPLPVGPARRRRRCWPSLGRASRQM